MEKQKLTESKKGQVIVALESALVGMILAGKLPAEIGAMYMVIAAGVWFAAQGIVDVAKALRKDV